VTQTTSDDTFPPVWATDYPKPGGVTETTERVLVKTDEAGTAYFVCLPGGATAPSVLQVRQGRDAADQVLVANLKGNVALTADTETNWTATGLTAGTTYTDTTDSLTITQTATVTFTAGPASASQSTVTASPTSVVADGSTTSTITVTLKDANGNPVSGKTVALAHTSGPGTPTISAASGPSDASGVVTFTVKSTAAGAAAFTATDTTDSVTITQTATVTFTAGPVSASQSTVTASPTSVVADGVSQSTITVTLKDANGNPVSGKMVALAHTSGPGTPTISAASGPSDASGVVTFTVKSATTGADVFTATDTTDSVTITQTATVTFTTGPASPATSTITAAPTSITANGTSTSTITVQLKDAFGNNLTTGGATVTLATTAGTLGNVTDNGDGTYTATLTSATAPGTATITGKLDEADLVDNATVSFAVGSASPATSTITAAPTTITADGTSTSVVTVQLKDAFGNNLTAGGATVTLATTAGTLGNVTDNGNGTYTATLTSAAAPGTATITGKLGGVDIVDTETVTFKVGVALTLTLHGNETVATYYKYGPTPDAPTPHWYEFLYDGTTGAEIDGNTITLHFVDGQRGDADLIANGVLVDPGAPGVPPGVPVNIGNAGGQLRLISFPSVATNFNAFAGLLDLNRNSFLARWVPGKASDPTYLRYEYLISGGAGAGLSFDTVENGVGYWHKSATVYAGVFTQRAASFDLPLLVSVDPWAHWNLIGVPHTRAVNFASLQVVHGGVTRSLANAADAVITGNFAWKYLGPTQGYQLVSVPGLYADAATTLEPGLGYWFWTDQDCTLRYPVPARSAELGARSRPRGARAKTGGRATDWLAQLEVRGPGCADACNYFGVGAARSRLMNPPRPAEGRYVDLYFVEPTRGAEQLPLAAGVKPSVRAAATTWTFDVDTNVSEGRLTLTWPDLSVVPSDTALRLVDSVSGKTVNMRTSSAYGFTPDGRAPRRFEIRAEAGAGAALRIAGLTAVPTRGGAFELIYNLSQPADVSARVLSAGGRVVSSLPVQQAGSAGRNRLVWGATAADGRRLPRGLYLLELVARSGAGEVTRAVAPLRLP